MSIDGRFGVQFYIFKYNKIYDINGAGKMVECVLGDVI